jgi:hypothetical protein
VSVPVLISLPLNIDVWAIFLGVAHERRNCARQMKKGGWDRKDRGKKRKSGKKKTRDVWALAYLASSVKKSSRISLCISSS